MAFLWLTNSAGEIATAQDNCGRARYASGYNAAQVISGPRSTCWRATARAGDMGLGYQLAVDTDVDYIVVARADWALTKNGMRLRGTKRSSGGTWSYISGFDYNTLAAADLVGPREQDLVVTVDVGASLRGIGIIGAPSSGTEALQVSKIYGAVSFELDVPPGLNVQWEDLPAQSYSTCLQSSRPYEIERRYSLVFNSISTAKLQAFESLTAIRTAPLFLYDSDQAIFNGS